MQQNLSYFLFIKLAKYIKLITIIFSLSLALLSYYLYAHSQLTIIENRLEDIKNITQNLESAIQTSSKIINTRLNKNPERFLNNKYSLRTVFDVLNVDDLISGAGYFWESSLYKKGEYAYKTPLGNLIIKTDQEIYANHKVNYYNRIWYHQLISSKQIKAYTPEPNWGGNFDTLSYFYPLTINNSVYAILVFDISMNLIYEHLKEIGAKQHNLISLYLLSLPYPTIHKDIEYYNLKNPKSKILDKLADLNYIYNKLSSGKSSIYYHGSLYWKKAYLSNGLILIIQYKLTKLIIAALLWLVITLFILQLILKYIYYKLNKILTVVTAPIAELTDKARSVQKNVFSDSFSFHTISPIKEINYLTDSLELMRQNINTLKAVEIKHEQVNAQLNMAADIHKQLIKEFYNYDFITHQSKCYSISVINRAANLVSGDIYDVFVSDNYIYLFIGDAMGKDVMAAFYALFTLGQFKVLSNLELSPDKILKRLNQVLCQENLNGIFISACCIRIGLNDDITELSCAGNEFPLLYNKDNQLINFDPKEPDLVLGLIDNIEYQKYLVNWQEVKYLALFTDGVTEVRDFKGELFGVTELELFIKNKIVQNITSRELCQDIYDYSLQVESKANDDKTIIILSDVTHTYLLLRK